MLKEAELTVADESKKEKQIAFGHGLWSGFLVGAVATGLLFKYGIGRKDGGRREASDACRYLLAKDTRDCG